MVIVLSDLRSGRKGITPAFGQTLEEAASVCLEERGHSSPKSLQVVGFVNQPTQLEWISPSDQSQRCWNDDGEATEQGAYGIAALLVEQCGLEVVQRSKKKTGFDFWLGNSKSGSDLFQNLARLEVSGIRQGDAAMLETRVRQKLKQTTPSDGELPAVVVVVEFGNPTAKIVEK